MIFIIYFFCWVVGIIGIWLGTYIGRILGLGMRYIGLILGFVILCILFCLLGGGLCGLGRCPHSVLGRGRLLRIGLFGLCDRGYSW